MDRFGLYHGEALFHCLPRLFDQIPHSPACPDPGELLDRLRALPATPAPDSDYGATYRPLKAYLITATNPDPDSPRTPWTFFPPPCSPNGPAARPPTLTSRVWRNVSSSSTPPCFPERPDAWPAAAGIETTLLSRSPRLSEWFPGIPARLPKHACRRQPQSPRLQLQRQIPRCPCNTLLTFMRFREPLPRMASPSCNTRSCIPDPFFRREKNGCSRGHRLALQSTASLFSTQLNGPGTRRLHPALATRPSSFPTRALPTPASSSAPSIAIPPLCCNCSRSFESTLALLHLTRQRLQAPKAVVPPSNPGNVFLAPTNQAYVSALQALEGAVKNLTLNATSANDPTAAAPVTQAAIAGEQAAENLRNSFIPDPAGGMDKTSFNLLQAPIKSAQDLASQAPASAAGGGAKTFCAQIGPVLAKFPFNPQSSAEATRTRSPRSSRQGQVPLPSSTTPR